MHRSCLHFYAPYFVRALSLLFSHFFHFGSIVPLGLGRYKSRPHLPKGAAGRAQQATQKEAVDAQKKKKTKEVQRKEEKKKEVARRVRAGESASDVESDDPTDLDDMAFSDEEESREVVATSAVRRDPAAMSAGKEQEAAWHAEVLVSRKRAASADVIGE